MQDDFFLGWIFTRIFFYCYSSSLSVCNSIYKFGSCCFSAFDWDLLITCWACHILPGWCISGSCFSWNFFSLVGQFWYIRWKFCANVIKEVCSSSFWSCGFYSVLKTYSVSHYHKRLLFIPREPEGMKYTSFWFTNQFSHTKALSWITSISFNSVYNDFNDCSWLPGTHIRSQDHATCTLYESKWC